MIYLIGGVPRAGKSTLAQKIVERNSISFIPTDMLFGMVDDTLPDYGLNKSYEQRAKSFLPFFQNFLKHTATTVPNYVIEGDLFKPAQVSELCKQHELKTCFLGLSYTSLELIKEHNGYNYWLNDLTEEALKDLPGWIMSESENLRAECEKYNLAYFDMAHSYNKSTEAAYSYLIA